MNSKSRKYIFLGLIAGLVSALFAKVRKHKPHNPEFRTSTQRIGLTFTDKIRDTFRARWLRPSK